MIVTRVRFEHFSQALGIGVSQPRISWVTETDRRDWIQGAYEIELYDAEGQSCATTGRQESGQSVLVPWPFTPLVSRQQVAVRVRVWGTNGESSDWSDLAFVEVGLLHPQDWSARFISPDWQEDITCPQPCPLLRREFRAEKSIRLARLYVTSLGVYEAYLNGQKIGDHILDPGWTSYKHRLIYQTFDITSLIHEGRNTMGAILGDGWFRGRLGYGGARRNTYGDRLALLAQIEVTYTDGTVDRIVSDESWRAATGPILASDLYDGEIYDARLERPGWTKPGYVDADWSGVRRIDHDLATLVAPAGPPVRGISLVSPLAITTSPSGKTLVDFGQNLVGHLRIMANGPSGQTITLRHAEVLENGELCTRLLRFADATDRYTLRGEANETWEPHFTYHGFRYAEITGWPGELKIENIQAVVCHSDMERTGWFECSDALINQLHQNVVWSMRGNFFSIPTDCPQRDERLGWTGDIQVFSPTASFLFDCAGFLSSWLADLAADQAELGSVPFFVPTFPGRLNPPAAAWGDAATVVPWVLYQRFGDAGVLAKQFDSMRAWVDLLVQITGEQHLWEKGVQFGDWLDPAAPPEKPGNASTPEYIVATAYFVRSAELVGQTAGVLGLPEIESYYLALARAVRQAFNDQYVTPAGRIIGDSATAYALALQFALLPDEKRRQLAGRRLTTLLRANRYRISTGFVGTPLICDALCSVGEYDAAYRLLTQRENPSWLYPVTMGATTIWERWDSLLPDGSVNPGEMTSFNHYALGAVADWLHRTVAGLAPAAPGYRKVTIQPVPGADLSYAAARFNSPYGLIESAWKIEDGQFHLEVTLPPNTTGTVTLPGLPGAVPIEIGSGNYQWSIPYHSQPVAKAPLSLDMSIGELIDYPEAFNRVMKILRADNFELTFRLERQIFLSLRQAAALMKNPDRVTSLVKETLEQFRQ